MRRSALGKDSCQAIEKESINNGCPFEVVQVQGA